MQKNDQRMKLETGKIIQGVSRLARKEVIEIRRQQRRKEAEGYYSQRESRKR